MKRIALALCSSLIFTISGFSQMSFSDSIFKNMDTIKDMENKLTYLQNCASNIAEKSQFQGLIIADSLRALALEEDNNLFIGDAYGLYGRLYLRPTEYDIALTYFHRAFAIYKEELDYRFMAFSAADIGVAHEYLGNIDSIDFYHNLTLEILDDPKLTEESFPRKDEFLSNTLINYGDFLMSQGNIEKANKLLEDGIRIAEEQSHFALLAIGFEAMARGAVINGNLDDAINFLGQAIDFSQFTDLSGPAFLNSLQMELARIRYMKSGDTDVLLELIPLAQEALALEQAQSALNAYIILDTAFHNLGKKDEAYKYLEMYSRLKDSITETSVKRQINQYDKIYLSREERLKDQLEIEQLKVTKLLETEPDTGYTWIIYFILGLSFGILITLIFKRSKG